MKWYFYIDWGSGYSQVTGYGLNEFNLKWVRGEVNDFIMRKQATGSFILQGDDADDAETFYITNGNYEAPFKIYENGDSGSGTLVFEGWARKSGDYDFKRKEIKLSKFRTNDRYETVLNISNNKYKGETILGYGSIGGTFASQGQNSSANKFYAFTQSSGVGFTLSGSISISNLGQLAMTTDGTYNVIYDNLNDTLQAYSASGSSWSSVASRTMNRYGLQADICYLSSFYRIIYETGLYEDYQMSGSTFNLVPGSQNYINECANVSGCAVNSSKMAIVDETSKTISILGSYTISVGEVTNPSICELDKTNSRIAFIDSTKQRLTAYFFDNSILEWKELGSIQLSGYYKPKLGYLNTDSVIIHDAIAGKLDRYDYTAASATWAKNGSTYTLSGGIDSAIATGPTYIGIAVSDSYLFKGSLAHSFQDLVNGLLFLESIYGTSSPNYELQTTGNGADVAVDDLIIQDMKDVSYNTADAGSFNNYQYKLGDVLKIYETLFQNYWYIDSSYKIKFIKPSNFSTIGTDYNITSLGLDDPLNQRKYKKEFDINFEELTFLNADGSDFEGNQIEYNRNSAITESTNTKFTTDLNQLIEIYTGQKNDRIESAGLVLHLKDDTLPYNTCASGTGIISSSDERNYKLSQSQIYNDYWKDYRYQESGNITINGSSSAVQNTVKNIIRFPIVELSYSQLGISVFPSSEPANLTWNTGIVSWIEEFSVNLGSNKISIDSRLLDI